MDLCNWTNAIVSNNIIDLGTNVDDRVFHGAVATGVTVKPINNLKNDGTLLRGYNNATQTHDAELTTDVEDVILGV
jgi:hypothetical protein